MADAAHFEDKIINTLEDAYIRHGEVARTIHQKAASEFAGRPVDVELVERNPVNPDPETFEEMAKYDVVSISSGFTGSYVHQSGAGNRIDDLIERFEMDMPVVIDAAGNDPQREAFVSTSDFTRKGMRVGESNRSDTARNVEEHSSPDPTLVSNNPFNDGQTFQFVNPSPSLEGHWDLVRNYVEQQTFQEHVQEALPEDFGDMGETDQVNAWNNAKRQADEYLKNEQTQQEIKAKVSEYKQHPEQLHNEILSKLRENYEIDAQGNISGLDGTSFSAPYQAGHITGALVLEEDRAEAGKPALTEEEITTIAKLSTMDVREREGQEQKMDTYTNGDGYTFTEYGGHGDFDPQLFRHMLDKAHTIIENDPDIDRDSISHKLQGSAQSSDTLSFTTPSDMVVERAIFSADSTEGVAPSGADIKPPGGEATAINMETTGAMQGFVNWSATERFMGLDVTAGQKFEARINGISEEQYISDGKLTLHGYPQGGMMDQLMQYRQELDWSPEAEQKAGKRADQRPDSEKSLANKEFERAAEGRPEDKTPQETKPKSQPESQREPQPDAPGLG